MSFKIRLILYSFLWLSLLTACNNNGSSTETTDESYKQSIAQNLNQLEEMDVNGVAQNLKQEKAQDEQVESSIIKELQGNWEWSGTIDGYSNSCRLGVSDDYAVLATPRGVLDQGKITIDLDDKTIHFGSTYFNYKIEDCGIRIGDFANGMYFHRLKRGTSSQSSFSNGQGNYSNTISTTFRTSSDVMAYVSNRFRNSRGNVITIKYDGLYSNGNQITNAVRVVRFNGSRASLTATSPYTQGTLYFLVDASRGTITDGSGDVFYKQ